MSLRKNQNPAEPKGGWAKKEDNFARCTKCGDGNTLLSTVEVSVKDEQQPLIPVAHVVRCCRCNWMMGLELLRGYRGQPSNAEVLGVTKTMLVRVLIQGQHSFFTMEELKSGVLSGAPIPESIRAMAEPEYMQRPVPAIKYNPDAHIEPEASL